MQKIFVVNVSKGSFVPDGGRETVNYCNLNYLFEPQAMMDGMKGSVIKKKKLDPKSFDVFTKSGQYPVAVNVDLQTGEPVFTLLKA
jgi:hypothetical protein